MRLSDYKAETEAEILQSLDLLHKEWQKRQGAKFDIAGYCYPQQLQFAADPKPYATAVTSRRAGKTYACAADLLGSALLNPDRVGLYITLSRVNAKILLWPVLNKINADYKLGGVPHENPLSMTFPNKAVIYLSGIKDKSEIEKFRGMAIKKVYLDEAQSMRPFVKELIDDVLDPAMIDYNGHMRVIGTPGPVPTGYFYEISQSAHWSHHHFTIWDNPFIPNARERLELVLKRRGVTIDHPSIQREWFGRWVLDLDSLVVKYDAARNDYEKLPDNVEWEHIVIADFGYEDADAIATLAFSTKHRDAYLVEEKITTKQGITPLAEQLIDHIKRYKPMKVLGDFGALGTKIAAELQTRFGIPIEAAEKSRKLEFIELLNDSLRTGRLKAKKDSRFAQDAQLLEWDRENPEKPKISDAYHSDIVDCVLYGHRELLHWLWKEPSPVIMPGSAEYMQQQEQAIWDGLRQNLQQDKDEQKFWQDPFEYDT